MFEVIKRRPKEYNRLNQPRDVLRKLKKRGLVLGVISNSDGRVRRLLKKFNLLDYFSVVIDSSIAGVEKPDKNIFHL